MQQTPAPTQRSFRNRHLPPPEWFDLQAARILFIIGALPMPSEIGGKKFASNFKSMIQDEVSKALAEGQSIIRSATNELKDAIKDQSSAAARVIREEAKHIREAFEEYTGNAAPEDEVAAEEARLAAAEAAGKVAAADPETTERKPNPIP